MNKRRLKKLCKKVSILAGLFGEGFNTTFFDRKPVLGRKEKMIVDKENAIEVVKKARRKCFRKACVDVLGEDPDTDWR